MSDKKNSKKTKISLEHLINIVILLIGIITICIGVFVNEKAETILVSIGASMVASSVVSFLTSIYILKYQRAKEISEIWGIHSIQEQRAIMNIQVNEHMLRAKEHIDIIAYGLKSLRENRTYVIENALKRNVQIRIITVSPNNSILLFKDKDENKVEGSTAKSIKELIKWASQLKVNNNNIEFRFCETLPSELYYRVDNYVYVGPYQFGRESQRTITTEYKAPGDGFKYYTGYFEYLWDNKNFCSNHSFSSDV
ncbi:MAG: hypothetical protein IJ859_08645 [Synergistaceae bacterium]|nr:hypothetical protein [Synergistaceae bacterium]MBR2208855.1 hypothetical protein [Synergistaceae bacterium]